MQAARPTHKRPLKRLSDSECVMPQEQTKTRAPFGYMHVGYHAIPVALTGRFRGDGQ